MTWKKCPSLGEGKKEGKEKETKGKEERGNEREKEKDLWDFERGVEG